MSGRGGGEGEGGRRGRERERGEGRTSDQEKYMRKRVGSPPSKGGNRM